MFNPKWIAVVLFTTLPLTATAQENSAASQKVFPVGIVMHDTILAAHLDLSQIDVPAIKQLTSQFAGGPGESPIVSLAESVIESLRDAGANDLYVSVPGRVLIQGGVCIVVPCDDRDAVSKRLTKLLDSVSLPFDFRVVTTDQAVVVCPAMMAEHFQKGVPDSRSIDRPEFNASLQSMAHFPHQTVVSLPEDIHEELANLWPDKLGNHDPTDFSPSRWIASVRSIAIGWSLPPKTAFELRIQSVDPAGAVACEQETSKLLKAIPPGLPRPTLSVDGASVVIKADPEKLQAFLAPMVKQAQQDAHRQQTMNNFKRLALAMHNFHAKQGFLPGKYTVDAKGRPLLSWRVALLPYLEQAPLYAKFKLDEPWDSEHNRPLAEQMPEVFSIAGDDLPAGKSRIRLPVIAGGLWSGEGPPRTLRDITDGTSATVWIATAPKSAAVAWTKPDDWQLDEAKLKEQFFGDQPYAVSGYADGSVHVLTPAIAAKTLKALLTMAGREVVQQDDVK
ncbi:DUF1559 domain-containing protein [Novipirellula rosea]|uniref:DUF1559 domain-containing protein n=1 Tax=Novipirellula rosea TaxID=1031540 RepID=A0ABP8MAQ2_9BACT